MSGMAVHNVPLTPDRMQAEGVVRLEAGSTYPGYLWPAPRTLDETNLILDAVQRLFNTTVYAIILNPRDLSVLCRELYAKHRLEYPRFYGVS